MNNSNYETAGDNIIFKHDFNDEIDEYVKEISKYKSICWNNSKYLKDFINSNNNPITSASKFNKKIDMLPNCLTYIHLGYSFNLPIKKLPEELFKIRFGDKFNSTCEFGYKVRQIIFGRDYTQSLGLLPEGVEKISLIEYKHSLADLPVSLKELFLLRYNADIINLPNGLEKLCLGGCETKTPSIILPNKLKNLYLEGCGKNILEQTKIISHMYPDMKIQYC